MVSKKRKPGLDPVWSEAKRKCRLGQEDIRMAKTLRIKPRSLVKNIPNKSQPWKAPVKVWIRDLYEKRFGPHRKKAEHHGKKVEGKPAGTKPKLPPPVRPTEDDELAF